jgi:fructosamine-3-kinase
VSADPIGGGCINHGARVRWDDGLSHFLKWNGSAPSGMFEAEADGLAALRTGVAESGARLRVPEPASFGEADGISWLLCEWIGPGPGGASSDRRLGEALAALHSVSTGASFGWHRDNWIGSLEQVNDPADDWALFWRDRRIEPQLALARSRSRCTDPAYDRLLAGLPEALAEVDTPSLLHGDLWSGNAYATEDGSPVVVDPAVYRGHHEVDLAMSELFGGFNAGFYEAYDAVRPVDRAYESHRRDVYQLYYLLVHVNLFGSWYEPGARAAAQRVAAALR